MELDYVCEIYSFTLKKKRNYEKSFFTNVKSCKQKVNSSSENFFDRHNAFNLDEKAAGFKISGKSWVKSLVVMKRS